MFYKCTLCRYAKLMHLSKLFLEVGKDVEEKRDQELCHSRMTYSLFNGPRTQEQVCFQCHVSLRDVRL